MSTITIIIIMVLITAAAILGFVAGTTLIISRQCVNNPTMCQGNFNGNGDNNNNGNFYYWTSGPRTVVNTGSGQLRGVTWTSRDGVPFSSFLGIPFGEIPTRFEPSRAYPKWNGVREASTFGAVCLQMDRKKGIISGQEDCLFLNVYTPQVNENALMPVMVWIDGSLGWQHGSGDKVNPRNFMDEKVVLVTFNFRQSSLGFLSTGDGEVQGNAGLKDQVLALQWVQQNIVNFGGDVDRVTIFGSDSGAASVHLHMLSPMSKDLFHRAISQSGSAHCPWTLQHNAASKAASLAKQLDCDHPTTKAMVECIRFKSGEEVVMAEQKMKDQNWNGEPYAMFGPTVEKVAFKSTPFLQDTPKAMIASGEFSKVPWVIGFNEEEGRHFVSKVLNSASLTNDLNSNWTSLAPISFFYDEIASDKDTISSQLQTAYFGGRPVGRDTWENYTNLYTDRYYLAGIIESVKAHAAMNQQVYPYRFKFQNDLATYTPYLLGDYRFKRAPSHFDELYYLFNWEWNMEMIQTPSSSSSGGVQNWYLDLSKKMVKLWVTFADTGIPQGWGTTSEWTPMNPTDPTIQWYVLDYDTTTMPDDPQWMGRLDTWKNFNLMDDSAL